MKRLVIQVAMIGAIAYLAGCATQNQCSEAGSRANGGPSLVSLWAADGNARDALKNNNGRLCGGASFTTGKVGLAFLLNGTSGYVVIPDSPSLNLTSNATLMAWFCLEDTPSTAGHVMQLVGKSMVGNDLDLQIETDNKIHFYVGGGVTISSTTVVEKGKWYHIVATYKANSQMELYVNNVREASQSITVARIGNCNPLTIGWNSVFPNRFFKGRIDQVRVFNDVISADEIQNVFISESTVQVP